MLTQRHIHLANGRTFTSHSDETLLESAKLQNFALEYSCRSGRCGVCKARVLRGETLALKTETSLTATERADGYILTCCRAAITDLVLDIEDLGEFGDTRAKTLPCKIDRLVFLTDDVVEVTIRTPPANRLKYVPGQYIDVIGKNGLRRSYSVVNAPRDDGKLTLQIRKVSNGEMSRYWFREAKINDLLRLEGPFGTFRLRQSKASQLVFLATGTGIAPIRAIIEHLAVSPSLNTYRRIHLYWGGRTEKDLYWEPHYPELSLRYIPVLSRSSAGVHFNGYVQDAAIADVLIVEDTAVYACGSENMIASARDKLIKAGLPQKNFHFEAFLSSK
jgi:CDP-4-dehydro-6-deoxyglucose reductase